MMKKYVLLLVFPLILLSCWWGAKRDPKPNYPIAGAKWQEVKLYIYHKTYHGLIFNDTTYQRPAFDTLDYARFFNTGIVNRSSQYYYSFHDVFTNQYLVFICINPAISSVIYKNNKSVPSMNRKPLILFAIILMASTACKKDNNNSLAGKWQEVKLRVYNRDKTTGAISNDTTYQAAKFNAFDYVQFSGSNACTISRNLPSVNNQLIETYTYAHVSSGYALSQTSINSGSIDVVPTMDTLINLSGNSIVVHSVAYSANPTFGYTMVFDAYYSR